MIPLALRKRKVMAELLVASRVHLSVVKVQRRNIPKRPLITKVNELGKMQKIRDIFLHFYHFFFYFC